ncbi:uncharacterized protein LOC135469119 [Liolophura sinensis]|uniref:uncharacterized protein LOC135469119 n=1 Tax=Liolophura sinensis TaxID=3198878 RepID=UPI0031585407
MDTSAYLVLALFLIALASSVSGLSCYECNVECRNNTNACIDKDSADFINDTESSSKRISCDSPAEVQGCISCMKIRTGYRRYEHRGEFIEGEIISKVCQRTQETPYSDDTCKERGPGWSLDVLCYCFTDYCNSASRLTLTFPILALLLHALI